MTIDETAHLLVEHADSAADAEKTARYLAGVVLTFKSRAFWLAVADRIRETAARAPVRGDDVKR